MDFSNNKLKVLLLCLLAVSVNAFAEVKYVELDDLTVEKKEVPVVQEAPMKQKSETPSEKNVNRSADKGLGFSLSKFNSIEDFPLNSQTVFRLAYNDYQSNVYYFISYGLAETFDNLQTFQVTVDNVVLDSDYEFSSLNIGIGTWFDDIGDSSIKPYVEAAFNRYAGENSSMTVWGYYFGGGIKLERELSDTVDISPYIGIRYEYLGNSSAGGQTIKFYDPMSGMAINFGAEIQFGK